MPGVVIERGAVVRRAIIDANVVIDAGDDIGYSLERDGQRFHALGNVVVIVSPSLMTLRNARRKAERSTPSQAANASPVGRSDQARLQMLAPQSRSNTFCDVTFGGSFCRGSDLQGFLADAQQHATENDVMHRCYRVPIKKAKQTARTEQGTLLQRALELTLRRNAKLDQCFAG
jgi:hypothetical protein